MKNNAYIFETDTFRLRVYDESETVQMFGEDYLEDYGHIVPTELIERYKKNEQERKAIADELRKIKESQNDTY